MGTGLRHSISESGAKWTGMDWNRAQYSPKMSDELASSVMNKKLVFGQTVFPDLSLLCKKKSHHQYHLDHLRRGADINAYMATESKVLIAW